jgi:divalent metal cation (Fe/Co/Zn/Cd) transporter
VFRLPVLDPVTAFLVSLWIMKSGVAVFLEGSTELMDGGGGRELYKALFDAVRSVPGAASPHRARIRKIASRWDIDLDIEVDGALTVRDAHRIAMGVEQAIHAAIPDVYDIVVHVEPANEGERFPGEQYGLSEADVR